MHNRHNPLLKLLALLCLALGAQSAAAAAFVPSPPEVEARGYILQDYHSGRTLAQQKADERMEPASLTKLMTAYAVFQELRSGHVSLDEMVRVSKKAWQTPGSRMFIEVGDSVAVEALLKGMIIQSGNDASVALAEHIAGGEDAFAALMNEHARRLGLTGTHFVNSTGLPHEDHYTTPRDMARLTSALIHEFPEYYEWYSVKKYTYNDITQYNRNKLLWRDEHVDGVKTGHTESAGYCLVSSAQKEKMRLIAVVMGTDSENARARESQKLLNYGFRFFETHRLYDAGTAIKQVRIWKGASENLALGLSEPLYATVPRGRYDSLQASMQIDGHLEAPANKGRRYGTLMLRLGEEPLVERPLVALQDVAKGGIWEQLKDSVLLLFQ